MMTFCRTVIRRGLVSALAALATTAALFLVPASGQAQGPAPAQKEVTDGFFDVPARAAGEEDVPWGLPAYLVTSGLGGLAIFVLCKSARRS